MIETGRAIRSEELLFERERLGIRTLMVVRGIFALIIMAATWILGTNWLDKFATTAIAVIMLIVSGFLSFFWPAASPFEWSDWQDA